MIIDQAGAKLCHQFIKTLGSRPFEKSILFPFTPNSVDYITAFMIFNQKFPDGTGIILKVCIDRDNAVRRFHAGENSC
ncbi:Uncharacterised protein [Mycobacteroides abscessus subsp. abscessus]|nr:Uncharacterised protein [Mycobacteroides abscessus subsp. abscessus]